MIPVVLPVGPDQRWDADLVLSDRVVVTDRVRSKHSCFGDFATKLQYHIYIYIYVYYIYVYIIYISLLCLRFAKVSRFVAAPQ